VKPDEPASPLATDPSPTAADAGRPGAAAPADDSIAGLFRRLVDDLINLVRSELRLAGSEVRGKVEESAVSLGAIIFGVILISVAMFCLLGALIAFLSTLMDVHWAALIVAVSALAIGGGLIYWGIRTLQSQDLAPSRAVANMKRNAELLKGD
jgi:uncharacterized membrane protein YqjE